MKAPKKYFGHDMYIGVYFLNIWMEESGHTDIQELFASIEKQPFKALPQMIQAGVNSAVEIKGEGNKINFYDACLIFEEYGVNSQDFQNIISDLTASLKIDDGEKKPKAKAKKSQ